MIGAVNGCPVTLQEANRLSTADLAHSGERRLVARMTAWRTEAAASNCEGLRFQGLRSGGMTLGSGQERHRLSLEACEEGAVTRDVPSDLAHVLLEDPEELGQLGQEGLDVGRKLARLRRLDAAEAQCPPNLRGRALHVCVQLPVEALHHGSQEREPPARSPTDEHGVLQGVLLWALVGLDGLRAAGVRVLVGEAPALRGDHLQVAVKGPHGLGNALDLELGCLQDRAELPVEDLTHVSLRVRAVQLSAQEVQGRHLPHPEVAKLQQRAHRDGLGALAAVAMVDVVANLQR
mmetsp:Transcript_99801/g.321782  ORF Transcript_99801/g.321782 Transcript_99801/m.321782 type:complete len:291 (-) Transcript_99801:2121-2993(-)